MLNWPLLSGPLPIVVRAAAIGAAFVLLWHVCGAPRPRWVKAVAVAGCVVAAIATTVIVADLARNVWMLFPDLLPPMVLVCCGAAILAMAVAAVAVALDPRPLRAFAGLVAAAVIVAACANQVNAIFGAYPTAADALGISQFDRIALPEAGAQVRLLPDADPVAVRWSPPPQLVPHGKLTSAPIPAPISGFAARDAEIYFSPAYFADPRPQLPVLVLLAGQPGTPLDWLRAGHLLATMDAFAAAHQGLTPVVVVVDATASPFGNPLCADSRLGNADSYLARDVPAWIKTHLTVEGDPHSWAVGGLSYGGTCALQLATNHPGVYPTFLDISGAAEPSLGDRQRTVAAAFGGDQAAFARINPLDLLRTHRYPGSAGAIVVGAGDLDTKGDARAVYDATRAAGMNTHYLELPGAHDWRVFSAALADELPWLAHRMGLT